MALLSLFDIVEVRGSRPLAPTIGNLDAAELRGFFILFLSGRIGGLVWGPIRGPTQDGALPDRDESKGRERDPGSGFGRSPRTSERDGDVCLHRYRGQYEVVAVDDLLAAHAVACEAIVELATREPEAAYVAVAIESLALGLALRGDLLRAATLEGYVEPALLRHGFGREFNEATTHNRLTALLREQLAPDDVTRLLADGAALAPEAAVSLALAP